MSENVNLKIIEMRKIETNETRRAKFQCQVEMSSLEMLTSE